MQHKFDTKYGTVMLDTVVGVEHEFSNDGKIWTSAVLSQVDLYSISPYITSFGYDFKYCRINNKSKSKLDLAKNKLIELTGVDEFKVDLLEEFLGEVFDQQVIDLSKDLDRGELVVDGDGDPVFQYCSSGEYLLGADLVNAVMGV